MQILSSEIGHMLMNPATGSVDTHENWRAEMSTWETNTEGLTPQQQFDRLVPVRKDILPDQWTETETLYIVTDVTPSDVNKLVADQLKKHGMNVLDSEAILTTKGEPGRIWVKYPGKASPIAYGG